MTTEMTVDPDSERSGAWQSFDGPRRRVLQVTAIPTTMELFVLPLARALRSQGFEVELATGPGDRLSGLEAQGFRLHRLPISRSPLSWRNLHALGAIHGLLRAGRHEIVHTHTPAASTLVRLAAGSKQTVFYTMHGSLWGDGVPRWRQALFTSLERRLAPRTDRVFVLNPEDLADCRRRAGYDEAILLPAGGAGVAPELFEIGSDPERRDRARVRARAELGASPDDLVVGYVGRTVERKGLGLLADAFARILPRHPASRLVIVGDAVRGDRRAFSRERFLGRMGPSARARTHWLGFRERVASWIAAMDLVVLPSWREGFGMSLAEAAAVGRPVVATSTRGARAVVEPDVTGCLVPIGDPDALAAAVSALLGDAGRRQAMGEAAQRRARARFSRDRVLAMYLAEYGRVRS